MAAIEAALEKGDVEAAKDIARNTRGPIASIYYQGLLRIDQGLDVVEKSVVSYGGVQAGYPEKRLLLDYTVHRNGSVFGILGYCNRYGAGI